MSFGDDSPVLFETMVLGGTRDRELYRYCTWEEAQNGHRKVVELTRVRGPLHADPCLSKAQELAHQTLRIASKASIASLVERSFTESYPAR